MLEGVSPALVQGGAVALLGLVFITLLGALWKGLLYTKPQYEAMMKIQEARVKTAEDREARLQQLADRWQQAAEKAIDNNEANLEQGRTIISLLQSLPRGPRR